MNNTNPLKILVALALMWLAFTITLMGHEWTHGFMAWIFGFKAHPFDIHYGSLSFRNLLFWPEADEHVNYVLMGLAGHPIQAALVAITPTVIYDTALAGLAAYWILKRVSSTASWNWFFLWLYLWNFCEVSNYPVVRGLSTHADMGNFNHYTGLSPLWIFIAGIYVTCIGTHLFFAKLIPCIWQRCNISSHCERIFLHLAVLSLGYVFFTYRVFDSGSSFRPEVRTVSLIYLAAIPIITYAYWPKRTP